MIVNTALAQEVTVDGVGVDKNSAIRDAMRNAVSMVIGTFIDSRTLVDQSMVALDEIYAKAQGFVKNVDVLDENTMNGTYRVKARIDVDTNPNAQLMNQLNMIMLLNDPRIAVVVDYYDDEKMYNKDKYPVICEAAMNSKLLELGFHHVVDSSVIRQIDGTIDKANKDTDYIVLGNLDITTDALSLPRYGDLTREYQQNPRVDTNLVNSIAELDVKVMKTDTQEIIGHFRVENKAIQNNRNSVENQAIQQLGIGAAENLRKIFAIKASEVSKYMRVIVRTNSNDNLLKIENELKRLSGVREAFIRSYDGDKGLIEVDSDLKPTQIYRMLRENNNLFMETASENTLEISI